jgi:hypothetical protein
VAGSPVQGEQITDTEGSVTGYRIAREPTEDDLRQLAQELRAVGAELGAYKAGAYTFHNMNEHNEAAVRELFTRWLEGRLLL